MTAPGKPLDLDGMEKKLTGSGGVMVCRHPDIDAAAIDDPSRTCLIDEGKPDQCEFSATSNPDRVLDKGACPYWALKMRSQPRRLSIKESLALIQTQRELVGALTELHRECVAAAKRAGTTWPLSGPARALEDKVLAAITKALGEQPL